MFIYVKQSSLERPEVRSFVQYYLSDEGQSLVSDAHCVRMNAEQLQESRRRLNEAIEEVTR
jgi:phosphate transport system substrate-binding protein